MTTPRPVTGLCRHTLESVSYRDRDVVGLLRTQEDFTRVMASHILGRAVTELEYRVINAALVTVMEHGLTPSAIASRLVYMSAPENLQGAVSAGLLAVGSSFVGTMENCARLIGRLLAQDSQLARDKEAAAIVSEHLEAGRRLPGFGHHLHRPDDPRAVELLRLGQEWGVAGKHVAALRLLGDALDQARGAHVTINATGAIAALFGEVGIPLGVMRGFAVISRAAGLVAHIAEEQSSPSARYIWDLVDRSIPFEQT